MNQEDIVYLSTLFISIALGYIFQNIKDTNKKKWFSTIIGFIIALLVSRTHIFHAILLWFFIAIIVQSFSSKYCHIVSFILGFIYLIFFRTTEYFGISYPPGHANMMQMILTLKLIGLAFEVHDNFLFIHKLNIKDEVTEEELYRKFPKPTLMDIFHYSFCYAGILTGPYYSYRTYCDVFQHSSNECKLCFKEVIKTLTYIPLFMILYLVASHFFPLQYVYVAEFYTNTSVLYRLWYMYPTFFAFRMRLYVAFKLSEAVCIMAGIGLYPISTKPRAGSGPTANFSKLNISNEDETYSFETIRSVNVFQCEFSYTVREATRHWNRCVQYWLATYVYHRFPYKRRRTLVTFFISSLWHGIHAGYYFSLFSVPFYLMVEDKFRRRIIKNKSSRLKNFFLWNVKMFQFSYWGLAFQLKNYVDVWNYGISIYFMPYFVAIGMYVFAIFIR